MTSHLLTLNQGTHIKSTVRVPNNTPKAITAAVDFARPGLPRDQAIDSTGKSITVSIADTLIGLVDAENALTPYGSAIDLSGLGPSPMKPVTHGQLIFTSLNVIDRLARQSAPSLRSA